MGSNGEWDPLGFTRTSEWKHRRYQEVGVESLGVTHKSEWDPRKIQDDQGKTPKITRSKWGTKGAFCWSRLYLGSRYK